MTMPAEQKKVVLITLGLFIMVKMMLLFLPVKKILEFSKKSTETPVTKEKFILLKNAITIVDRHIPWNTKCLDKALTGKYLYNVYNIPTQLYFGTIKKEDTFEAHAWLKYREYFITGEINENAYATIALF